MQPQPAGLVCARCGATAFRVNKVMRKPGLIRRRRVCKRCGRVCYTSEVPCCRVAKDPPGRPAE